jgi:hypothetical protein
MELNDHDLVAILAALVYRRWNSPEDDADDAVKRAKCIIHKVADSTRSLGLISGGQMENKLFDWMVLIIAGFIVVGASWLITIGCIAATMALNDAWFR